MYSLDFWFSRCGKYMYWATQLSGLTYNKLNYMIRREDNRICGRNERKKFYNFQLSERWVIIFIDHCFLSRMHMVHLATGSNICYLHPKWNHLFVLHLEIVESKILKHKITVRSVSCLNLNSSNDYLLQIILVATE